jgi:hypothetical protein
MAPFSSLAFFALTIASAGAEEIGVERQLKGDATACMLAVTNGIDELLNAGTYLWSATERCSNTANGVRCSSDIFSVVENVLRMSSFMIKGMKACGGGKGANQCDLTSLKFGAAASGLTAASLEMSVACKPQTPGAGKKFPLTANANCLPNIAGALTSLGSTIADLTQIKKKCTDNAHCYAETLDTLSAIAHMGECIWQTVEGSCIIDSALAPMNNCVQAIASGAKNLMAIGSSALTVASDCKLLEPTKLYEAAGPQVTAVSAFTPLNAGLAALFPLTAVVAFVRGTRDAKKDFSGEHELVDSEGM